MFLERGLSRKSVSTSGSPRILPHSAGQGPRHLSGLQASNLFSLKPAAFALYGSLLETVGFIPLKLSL